MPDEIVVRYIPHDEVLSLREDKKRLEMTVERLQAQLSEAQLKYASECHINMALQDEVKHLRKENQEWRMICNV